MRDELAARRPCDTEFFNLIFYYTKVEKISDHAGGSPYKVSVSDYKAALFPLGFKAISIDDNELAIEPRKGRENIRRRKRLSRPSL